MTTDCSAYGAVTVGARWSVSLSNTWTLELEAERHKTDGARGLYEGDEAPAPVTLWRGTIGLIWRFD